MWPTAKSNGEGEGFGWGLGDIDGAREEGDGVDDRTWALTEIRSAAMRRKKTRVRVMVELWRGRKPVRRGKQS